MPVTKSRTIVHAVFLTVVMSAVALSFSPAHAQKTTVRVGYFPNITHSQAVIGIAEGAFQKALGQDAVIDARVFNAGPSVIEALFAGVLDLAYIGPNPAINGYIRSDGAALRIIAGATSGGAALVVRSDAGMRSVRDFHGRKIASPQLGNTQDVSLRAWLKNNGFILKEKGGDVTVIPIANPDQLTLFLKKEIDGAWTVEPWVSRLVQEGKGAVYLEESSLWEKGEYVTAHIIVSKKFLDEHPVLVKDWIRAHVELTRWINDNPRDAKKILNAQIKKLTGKALADEVMDSAFGRIKIVYDPLKESLFQSARWAFQQGFLGSKDPDLSGIYDLRILNEVLEEKQLPGVN
jgi:NitT/TauT family transport system substrate-binding protein